MVGEIGSSSGKESLSEEFLSEGLTFGGGLDILLVDADLVALARDLLGTPLCASCSALFFLLKCCFF